jgi:hypothetical protein
MAVEDHPLYSELLKAQNKLIEVRTAFELCAAPKALVNNAQAEYDKISE